VGNPDSVQIEFPRNAIFLPACDSPPASSVHVEICEM
jgi:hypothetical protein